MILKLKLLFCVLSIGLTTIVITSFGQKMNVEWGNGFGGNLTDYGYAIAADMDNNTLVAGGFTGTADFDPGPDNFGVKAIGLADVYINKFDAKGDFVWARTMGGRGSDNAYAVTTDAEGNVYATGAFGNTGDFDPGPDTFNLVSKAYTNVFIVKLDKNGALVWAKSIAGTGTGAGMVIRLDRQGNIYVGGSYGGKSDFNPGTAPADTFFANAEGYVDAFVLKLDTKGDFLWAWTAGGEDADQVNAIALDESGNSYVTGGFYGQVDFDPGPGTQELTSTAFSPDGFVLKLDVDGAFVWNKQIGGPSLEEGRGIVLGPAGNIYLAGVFGETADFDPGPNNYDLTAYGTNYQSDGFLAKWDSSGNFIWARQIGGEDLDEITGLGRDDAGNLYALGTFKQTAYFTPDTTQISLVMNAASTRDIFLAKYTDSGSFLWVDRFGETGYSDGRGLFVDGSANVYLTGNYVTVFDCDPSTGGGHWINSNGLHDVYAIKLVCADTSSSSFELSLCADSFIFVGRTYSESGDYQLRISNFAGCDSTISFHLELNGAVEKPVVNVNGFELGITATFYRYQWLLNGQAIPGATESRYNVLENGSYAVIAFNDKGCSDTSEIYNITNVGLESYHRVRWTVYPNPAKDKLYLDGAAGLSATLLDIQGRILWQGESMGEISLDRWADGIYFLRITGAGQQVLQTFKITKQAD